MKTYPFILGVMLGDGCLSIYPQRGDYRIQLDCVDKEFADAFFRRLIKIIPKVSRKYYAPSKNSFGKNPKWKYRIVAWNKNFVLALDRLLKLLPQLIEFMNKKELGQLIKGFYDSEGSYYNGEQTSKLAGKYKHHRITLYNTNKKTIEIILNALELLRYRTKIYEHNGTSKKCYYIRITHKEDVNRFFREIGTSIPRKNGGQVKTNWRIENLRIHKR